MFYKFKRKYRLFTFEKPTFPTDLNLKGLVGVLAEDTSSYKSSFVPHSFELLNIPEWLIKFSGTENDRQLNAGATLHIRWYTLRRYLKL